MLAALGARSPRNALALALAVPASTCSPTFARARGPLGVDLAFANDVLFGLYIVLADQVAERPALSGIDGLGTRDARHRRARPPVRRGARLRRSRGLAAGTVWASPRLGQPLRVDRRRLASRAWTAPPTRSWSRCCPLATVVGIVVLTQVPSAEEVDAWRWWWPAWRRTEPAAA